MGFSKVMKLQKLDTSPKAILESYGEDLLGHLIKEEKDILKVNMGDGTFMEVSKQSEIALNIDNYNHYTISVRDPKTATFRQVTGSTKDLTNTLDLIKSYSFFSGSISLGLSFYYERLFNKDFYKPVKGPNRGIPTDFYARNRSGSIKTRRGKPRLRSSNAEWHSFKGKTLKNVGKGLNILGLGLVAIDIKFNGLTAKNSLDMFMAGIAFIPKVGWIISGVYFLLDLFGVIDWMLEQFGINPNKRFFPEKSMITPYIDESNIDKKLPYNARLIEDGNNRIPLSEDTLNKLKYEINKKETNRRLPYSNNK